MYGYVGGNPVMGVDPRGLVGLGVSGGGTVEAGLLAVGAGGQGSAGFGGFLNTNNWSVSKGAFASGGVFAGGPGWGRSAPSQPGNGNWVVGGYARGGAGIWLSNANNVGDFSGPFKTYSFNAAWFLRAFTIQFSVGQSSAGQNIWMLYYGGPLGSLPTGGGWGLSISGYNTYAVTTNRGCR
jgi:hypothetical protein